MKTNPHIGSSFDDFLQEEGTLTEVEALATKRVIAAQISQAMKNRGLSKTEMARIMQTSRPQLNRLLDPNNSSVTLKTMAAAAKAVGKSVRFELVNAEPNTKLAEIQP